MARSRHTNGTMVALKGTSDCWPGTPACDPAGGVPRHSVAWHLCGSLLDGSVRSHRDAVVTYIAAPAGTAARLDAANAWLARHGQAVIVLAAAVIGCYFVVKGLVGLV